MVKNVSCPQCGKRDVDETQEQYEVVFFSVFSGLEVYHEKESR